MLFNSLEFAVFFPVVAALYFVLPQRHRVALLLVSSCIFYMAFIPAYILILGVTIAIDYCAGIWLERTEEDRLRRLVLITSIAATCAVLFVFKYFYFVVNNAIWLTGIFGWRLTGPSINIILPIGLSFHTFQSLSYVIEVYRRRQKAEHNFLVYATYVMFFPQLVAGPIERPQNLLHQFYERHEFDYLRITSGLKRMAWGFFKKLVVADRLALYVNDVYANPQAHNGLQLSIATVFFAYQIYCDFSGYSDIAIGSARVLGFRLMENFRSPYHSGSVAEFWQRWHISLSTWFRDYIYIPLGAKYTYEQSKEFGRVLVTIVQSQLPKFTSIERIVQNRQGKMYLDFLQNRPQATLAAPYSLRPKPGATVSMPLYWEEVKKGLKIKNFTIFNAVDRINETGDIFKGVIGKGINLKKVLKNINSFFGEQEMHESLGM